MAGLSGGGKQVASSDCLTEFNALTFVRQPSCASYALRELGRPSIVAEHPLREASVIIALIDNQELSCFPSSLKHGHKELG